jgi:hypothetical protein
MSTPTIINPQPTITITQAQFDELIAQRAMLIESNAEMLESLIQVGEVLNFLKDKLLGGKLPDGDKDLTAMFYAKMAKNLASMIFNIKRDPAVFSKFLNALKYLGEVAPKYLPKEDLEKLIK